MPERRPTMQLGICDVQRRFSNVCKTSLPIKLASFDPTSLPAPHPAFFCCFSVSSLIFANIALDGFTSDVRGSFLLYHECDPGDPSEDTPERGEREREKGGGVRFMRKNYETTSR